MYFSEQSDDGQFHLCGRIYVENANGQLYVMQKKGHFVAKLNLLGFFCKKENIASPLEPIDKCNSMQEKI